MPKRSYPNVRISFDLLNIYIIYINILYIYIYQNSTALFLESENGLKENVELEIIMKLQVPLVFRGLKMFRT